MALMTEKLRAIMALDPEWVAEQITAAIVGRRHTLSIGLMERIFAKLNAVAPKLIDRGLAAQVQRARAEFS